MTANDHSPGAYNADPDRFPEGFSIFIASGSLIALWETGTLRLPKGFIAELFYVVFVGLAFFGALWAIFGIVDRYTDNY